MTMQLKMKFFAVVSTLALSPSVFASGIPVIDGANLAQSVKDYVEVIAQGARQASQYALQLQQYENEILRYREMLKARELPTGYMMDTIYNDTLGYRDLLNIGGLINREFPNANDMVSSLWRLRDQANQCYLFGRCDLSNIQVFTEELSRISQSLNDELKYQLTKGEEEYKATQQYAEKTNSKLMDQIKSSTSQLQGIHATAQATVAVADAVNNQTMVMQQTEYNRRVEEAQKAELDKASRAKAFSHIGSYKQPTTKALSFGGNTKLFNEEPKLNF